MTECNQESIDNAVRLMQNGWLNRYQVPKSADDEDAHECAYLLKCERALANYIGVKYAIGLNSGASAIFMGLKCSGFPDGSKVLSNSFTFNAVPSAIVHANMQPVLVECDELYLIDLDDLEKQAVESGAKLLVLSYMRGRIPNMDRVMEMCDRLGLYLIEDSAHAYGCEWNGKKIGTYGRSACMSTQANKLMNSGEGGFLMTNEDTIMGKAICHAGSYEEYMLKHQDLCPPMDLMIKYRVECVNYSVRMTNLQGAILLPQVALMDERRENHNTAYYKLKDRMNEHPRLSVPDQHPQVTPVYDSLQFRVLDVDAEGLRIFAKHVGKAGLKVSCFGWTENARNWKTWEFIQGVENLSLPQTDIHIGNTLDCRLALDMTDEKIDQMVSQIVSGFEAFEVDVSAQ